MTTIEIKTGGKGTIPLPENTQIIIDGKRTEMMYNEFYIFGKVDSPIEYGFRFKDSHSFFWKIKLYYKRLKYKVFNKW